MEGSEQPDKSAEVSQGPEPTGLIFRQKDPDNLEMPFDRLNSFLTPTGLFYIRSHFPTPQLEPMAYRLQVDGAVDHPFSLNYQELRELPSETVTATLECAGNSRVFLVPQAEGAQWELGAVGNAEWTGVRLSALLERAGLAHDACDVVLAGADRGAPKEKPVPPGAIAYARSLPLRKALQPEVLIAYQMNGRDLPVAHGFPARAVVPGHYGMASVKWLTRIQVVREPFQGYWQTSDYAYWDDLEGKPVRRPLGEMKLKSQIARPMAYETVAPNQVYPVSGAAWAGETAVTAIAVSTNGGQSWAEATFIDPVQRHAWRRWKLEWLTPATAGKHTLLARAGNAHGEFQPAEHDPNYANYAIHHLLPIEVFVGDPAPPTA